MAMLGGTRRSGDRVLCLDGGGIRGQIILEILEEIEKQAQQAEPGTKIRDMFDWIGGTSTGGIIALGIATGMDIGDIKTLYDRLKTKIFKGSPPYDSTIIEDLLKEQFKDKVTNKQKVMTDIKAHKVLITSVLGDHHPWKLHLFRSYLTEEERDNKQPKDESFQKIKSPNETFIWEVARSTSAAPSYFHPYEQFFDGGIMSNNPTLDMLTEIQRYNEEREKKGQEPISLDMVVSIGCGYVDYVNQSAPDVQMPSWRGIWNPWKTLNSLNDAKKFFTDLLSQVTISYGQPSHRARAWCHMMKVSFFRLSPCLTEDVPMDCVDQQKLDKMIEETQKYMALEEPEPKENIKERIKKLVKMAMRSPDEPDGHFGPICMTPNPFAQELVVTEIMCTSTEDNTFEDMQEIADTLNQGYMSDESLVDNNVYTCAPQSLPVM